MQSEIVIALDAMGGDLGPEAVVPGAGLSLLRHPEIRYLMIGDETRIAPLLAADERLNARSEIVHTENAVPMDAKPSVALRQGRRDSSMWLAIDAVRQNKAAVAISSGNTGALMAMGKVGLKTVTGIERPALAAIWPTVKGECVVLDAGANVGATAEQLCQFAIMGAAMSRALTGVRQPTVGLLNIGVEEIKGLDEVRRAAAILREKQSGFRYVGFVEGDRIGHDVADVIVTEGFSGNIALKTAEGTARQIGAYLRAAMNGSVLSRIGALVAQGGFRALREKMDPRRMNGGAFLGLNGLVIKSHGGTDAEGFASAIDIGFDMAREGIIARIADDVAGLGAGGVSALAS